MSTKTMMMASPMKRIGGRPATRDARKVSRIKTTGTRTQVNADGYLDSFAPDTVLLRVGTPFDSLHNMFISTVFDETMDTCRKVLVHMPPTPVGHYLAMRTAMDENVDVPVRRIAFAMLHKLLGIQLAPVQYTCLPKFSDYKARVGCMIAAYERDAAGAAADLDALYSGFKNSIIQRLPLRRNRAQLIRDAVRDMHTLLGWDHELQNGAPSPWFDDCLASLDDNTKRCSTCSRNYYSMNLSEGATPAADTSDSKLTDAALGERRDAQEEPGMDVEDYTPDADSIDMMNGVAMECIKKIASGEIATSNAAARCTILLFVSTVRNATVENKAWPSRQELEARIHAVKAIIDGATK